MGRLEAMTVTPIDFDEGQEEIERLRKKVEHIEGNNTALEVTQAIIIARFSP